MSADSNSSSRAKSWAPPPFSIRAPSDESTIIDVSSVLHGEEVARTRVFFRVALAISLLTGGFIPFLEGEPWLRLAAAGLCALSSGVSASVLLIIRDPSRYTPGVTTIAGTLIGAMAVAVIYYIGPFSAGAMVLTLGVYFFGMSHSRMAARVSYATIALLYLVSSAGLAAGLLTDRALFSTVNVQPFTRWFQVIMSQAIFALTFYLARSSRRAIEGAIDRVNKANVQIQKRDALLDEARGELDKATRPGEGRHTGEMVGSFRAGDILGRGAMGEVYTGTDPAGLPVAIKMLHPNLVDSPDKVKRFLREAEAASAVNSPHVPKVYDSGFLDETPYLVMELLEGHDLAWHLRKTGKLRLELVVEMCEHVAKALAHVREAGVVHRDLKPGNLFLTDSLPRTWKVLDFGLSKVLWGEGNLTRDHAVGTPAYMAPEQVRGPTVDHLADLYALAAIAYRALTGIPPFSGNQVAHVLYRVVYQQPVCPGDLARVPIDIELVLAIGLAKKAKDRFESVEEFAAVMRIAFEGGLDDEMRARGWSLIKDHPWGTMRKPERKSGRDSEAAA